jgi:hypothetical protein
MHIKEIKASLKRINDKWELIAVSLDPKTDFLTGIVKEDDDTTFCLLISAGQRADEFPDIIE